jgi:hypothetical protein
MFFSRGHHPELKAAGYRGGNEAGNQPAITKLTSFELTPAVAATS